MQSCNFTPIAPSKCFSDGAHVRPAATSRICAAHGIQKLGMTFEEVRARNDKLRTTFRGGRVIMTLNVWSLPAQLRGAA
jgi:hypothetical protein